MHRTTVLASLGRLAEASECLGSQHISKLAPAVIGQQGRSDHRTSFSQQLRHGDIASILQLASAASHQLMAAAKSCPVADGAAQQGGSHAPCAHRTCQLLASFSTDTSSSSSSSSGNTLVAAAPAKMLQQPAAFMEPQAAGSGPPQWRPSVHQHPPGNISTFKQPFELACVGTA